MYDDDYNDTDLGCTFRISNSCSVWLYSKFDSVIECKQWNIFVILLCDSLSQNVMFIANSNFIHQREVGWDR